MWQELHSQQLPHGQIHATSTFLLGQGPFSNKKKLQGRFSFFFSGTKIILKSLKNECFPLIEIRVVV